MLSRIEELLEEWLAKSRQWLSRTVLTGFVSAITWLRNAPRRERIRRWREKREKQQQATYAVVSSQRQTALAWSLVVLNLGGIIAEFAWLGNIRTMAPSTCELQHFIWRSEGSISKLMVFHLSAVLLAVFAATYPSCFAHYRTWRNRNSFPRRRPIDKDFIGVSEFCLRRHNTFQLAVITASFLYTSVLILIIVLGFRNDTPDLIKGRWSEPVKACHPPATPHIPARTL